MNTATIIKIAQDFAESNYDYGMDYFIECYDHAQWVKYVGSDNMMAVLKRMLTDASDRAEYVQDIANS